MTVQEKVEVLVMYYRLRSAVAVATISRSMNPVWDYCRKKKGKLMRPSLQLYQQVQKNLPLFSEQCFLTLTENVAKKKKSTFCVDAVLLIRKAYP